jgi:hypothetical protein
MNQTSQVCELRSAADYLHDTPSEATVLLHVTPAALTTATRPLNQLLSMPITRTTLHTLALYT